MDNRHGLYIICGLGRAGGNVAGEMASQGVSFVCIEKDPKVMELYRDKNLMNNPRPNEVIEKGDTLILIGTSEQLNKVKDEML